MKLFGGSSSKHSSAGKQPSQETSPLPVVEIQETMFIPAAADRPAPEKEKKSRRKAPKALRIAAIALAALLVLGLGGVIAYSLWEQAPDVGSEGLLLQNTPKPDSESESPETGDPSPVITLPPATQEPQTEESPEPTPEPGPTGRNEDCYTFVIAANDQIGASTDTILVGRIDVAAGTLNVVSIPRDTLVNVEWGVKKVNTILANRNSDPEEFAKGLGDILGFTPDCYAVVSMGVVEALVNTMGGVLYTVPRDMHYDDPSQDLSIHIDAGYQWLSGEDAVKVLRFRMGNDGTGYATGDLGRIATQQDFLMSIAKQMLTLGNIPNLEKLIEIFEEYVKTDLTANNIAFFVREFLMLDEEDIHFYTLPGKGVYIRGGAYYQVELAEWTGMLNEYLNPYYDEITAENLNVLQFVDSKEGAYSTNGERVPFDSFYDFADYSG